MRLGQQPSPSLVFCCAARLRGTPAVVVLRFLGSASSSIAVRCPGRCHRCFLSSSPLSGSRVPWAAVQGRFPVLSPPRARATAVAIPVLCHAVRLRGTPCRGWYQSPFLVFLHRLPLRSGALGVAIAVSFRHLLSQAVRCPGRQSRVFVSFSAVTLAILVLCRATRATAVAILVFCRAVRLRGTPCRVVPGLLF